MSFTCFVHPWLQHGRSFLSLVFITLGAIGYVLTDKEFAVAAYAWVRCLATERRKASKHTLGYWVALRAILRLWNDFVG